MKKLSSLFLVSLLSGATTIGAYKVFVEGDTPGSNKPTVTVASPNYITQAGFKGEAVDFTEAADQAVHTVVHVKNVSYRTISNPIMEFFYGYRGGQQQEQIGTGSGVIISEDGYIVTNNHVVKDASNLEITLNDNSIYKAKLIGTDSKMDIALLKIDADKKLPYAVFADSDNVKVGEWVLAVGNPYNLTSTVTAGIISAKARNLGTDGIQSFIQTDAAVNPGNSGGALVNTRGELVGINTMISSMTGSYVGYSFAVPSNITRKIIEDIMEYGNVQRGILGVQGAALSGPVSKEIGVKQTSGFYISSVDPKSGAEKAGLKKGDIITQVDDKAVNTYSDLATYLNTKRPNDKVEVTFIRNDDTKTTIVQLTKSESIKGFDLEEISAADKKRLNIGYGVRIRDLDNERLMPYAKELKGGIILSINNVKITDVKTASKMLQSLDAGNNVQIEMITGNGQHVRFLL
jgi:serine protease Do